MAKAKIVIRRWVYDRQKKLSHGWEAVLVAGNNHEVDGVRLFELTRNDLVRSIKRAKRLMSEAEIEVQE